ncbi:MAG: ribonuclease P protein component [Ignavibacterium album]|uniref:Ribonuclease P protein component n=1 Tax=Ignavibacterium album TaxID=591197 RepID=A0A7V3E8U6_9BACT|nr:ribonuclease P protein component [Ignavibacterium album]MCX8106631.1 ribonuclease P protein component [Ignavibacterium album]
MKLFSLSKDERIKEKKNIQLLIQEGSSVFSSRNSLKAIYLIQDSDKPGVKIAVGISKKAGKAVWRNKLKRLIRNAYRLNKIPLIKSAQQKNKSVLILFTSLSYNEQNNKNLFYDEIVKEVKSLLEKIAKRISGKINTSQQ